VTLPSSIGQLESLQKLSLSGNRLQELPPEIGCLTALKYLNLSRTLIKELPVEISHLTQLEKFDLYDNYYLEQIPESVFRA
jgi:Leucine-rich repeat (LRR) protein